MKTFCIDFDGSCVCFAYPHIGQESPGCTRVLKRLVERGDRLILYTMRTDDELAEAVEWFKERGIPLWGVNENPDQHKWSTSRKVYATVYIDDTALGVPLTETQWSERPVVDWYKVEEMLFGGEDD